MLAATAITEHLNGLRYPLYASPKLDGIRCIIHPTLGPVTRSFKPVPNAAIRELLNEPEYHGLDGELMLVNKATGKPYPFNPIQSAVMSQSGDPTEQLEYWIFDWVSSDDILAHWPFKHRLGSMMAQFAHHPFIRVLAQTLCATTHDVHRFASSCIEAGYEGVVLRDPESLYKCNRSTLKQQGMIKYKEFADAEGVVTGFEQLYHNSNPQGVDNFGLAKRSDEKAGMVAADTLGSLVCSTDWGTLRIGTGFDAALRDEIWQNRPKYLGKLVTFKYQKHGMQDLPRFPVFLRFREAE